MKTYMFLLLLIISNLSIAQQKFDHDTWDQALLLNVSDDGNVNYSGFMRDSSLLYRYFQELSENTPDETWSRDERIAYWINAYNAYTIKLIIDTYPLTSIKDLKDPWDKKFFKIDGEWYSLNELEHKILRKFGDPRIHFAINCASASCPVVWNRAYTSENLQRALNQQTELFINDPSKNVITPYVVKVSKIFSWYKRDFKVNGGDVEEFINRYSKIKISDQNYKGYLDYDWSLNETNIENSAYVLD